MDASPWAGRDELLLVRWRLRTTQQTLEHPYALTALRQQGPTVGNRPKAGRTLPASEGVDGFVISFHLPDCHATFGNIRII
jgi:hypothetical protein